MDTYGSAARKDTGTVSQSLQLDEVRARELVLLLVEAFPGLSTAVKQANYSSPLRLDHDTTE